MNVHYAQFILMRDPVDFVWELCLLAKKANGRPIILDRKSMHFMLEWSNTFQHRDGRIVANMCDVAMIGSDSIIGGIKFVVVDKILLHTPTSHDTLYQRGHGPVSPVKAMWITVEDLE